ncbi:uncharacterized protein LOC101241194 [Hydra vulgaris]|uniref:Uncharacterized protein LOC101241194 n=1 Tax=Hydra vulgaris TaxID=6087 RepID=A0ABM4D323_HYDVU
MLNAQDIVNKPSKKFISLWILPPGSKPIVRVETENGSISASRLFNIGCSTLELYESSKPCFGLFQGSMYPIKKYASMEIIILPCKTVTTIQRWCFNVSMETKLIRVDPAAFRLLATQVSHEIKMGCFNLTEEEKETLESTIDPSFVTYKQYVVVARKIPDYGTMKFQNVEIVNSVKLLNNTLRKGLKIVLKVCPTTLMVLSPKTSISIPWRKVRRFTEINETKSVSFEVFLNEIQSFTWLEVKTIQGALLLQATAEAISNIKSKIEEGAQQQMQLTNPIFNNKLTFALIKSELFGLKSNKDNNKCDHFDEIHSSDDEDYKRQRTNEMQLKSINCK